MELAHRKPNPLAGAESRIFSMPSPSPLSRVRSEGKVPASKRAVQTHRGVHGSIPPHLNPRPASNLLNWTEPFSMPGLEHLA